MESFESFRIRLKKISLAARNFFLDISELSINEMCWTSLRAHFNNGMTSILKIIKVSNMGIGTQPNNNICIEAHANRIKKLERTMTDAKRVI